MSHSSRCSRPVNQSGLRDWWRKRPGYFSTSRPAEPPALWRSWSVKESSNDRIRMRAFLRTLFCRLEELLHCGGGHPLLYPLTGRVVSYVMFKPGGLICEAVILTTSTEQRRSESTRILGHDDAVAESALDIQNKTRLPPWLSSLPTEPWRITKKEEEAIATCFLETLMNKWI